MRYTSLVRILSVILFMSIVGLSAFAAVKGNVLYNFQRGGTGGFYPQEGLVMDAAGNLYGATLNGGVDNQGTIFELSPNGSGGWIYNVIVECNENNGACADSMGSLAMDRNGNLYGTTIFGNIFEVSKGASGWTASLIHKLTAGTDGDEASPLAIDASGNLYGTILFGGANGMGYVFELSQQAGSWVLSDLHDFSGSDGSNASLNAAPVTLDASGNIYGVTSVGGTSTNCQSGCGVAFELVKGASGWTETVLHDFTGNDGSAPTSPLLLGNDGNIYGTASSGGSKGFGVVFQLAMVQGNWKLHDIYSFSDAGSDGAAPAFALMQDKARNIYGVTLSGGGGSGGCSVGNASGCGTAYELSPAGSNWTINILHAFKSGGDGAFPQGLTRVGTSLIGNGEAGGPYGAGNVFQLFLKQ